MKLFGWIKKKDKSADNEAWNALWEEWCTGRPDSALTKTTDRTDIVQMLTTESPADFCGAFLKFYKSLLRRKTISPASIEKTVEILVCNKVRLHNGFIIYCLIKMFHHSPNTYARGKELGVLLEKRHGLGLAHESEEYELAKLLPELLGRDAYPWLIDIMRSEKSTEIRAAAIKSLAKVSGQHFDRGLPKDPGKWKLEDLRIKEVEAWICEGCPDGEGYAPPVTDPALIEPQSDFEKIVFSLNNKLKKAQDPSDFSSYDNYLICGDKSKIERLRQIYNLPENYLELLTRFSPCNVRISKGMYEICLYGVDNLEELQVGYSIDAHGNTLSGWPEGYLVIADRFADPYCIDTTGMRSGILFATHGQDVWKFSKKYSSLEDFLQYLAK